MLPVSAKYGFEFITRPLYHRIRLGEGGIIIFNLAHAWYATQSVSQTTIQTLISTLVLCALYGYNDFTDREADMNNPKKDSAFCKDIYEHASIFLTVNIVLSTAAFILCLVLIGKFQAVAVASLFAVNVAYSSKLKSIPVADIITVLIWGSLFVMIAGNPNMPLAVTAGIMTGIAHIFQMLTDKTSDTKNNVKTSIVYFQRAEHWLIVSLYALLSLFLFYQSNAVLAASTLIPLSLYLITRKVAFSWYLSRLYFFVIWIVLLYNQYAGF